MRTECIDQLWQVSIAALSQLISLYIAKVGISYRYICAAMTQRHSTTFWYLLRHFRVLVGPR